jgi:phosphoribosylanthranilate isomerase
MVRVKICGITSLQDAELACKLGAHAIGLNFYPKSPRAVSPFTAEEIIRQLPPLVTTVGVFVNWAPQPVLALAKALRLAAVQLHGDESPEVVAEIAGKIPVIKAFRVGQGSPKGGPKPNFARYKNASAFLLDADSKGQFGGTGHTADWQVAKTAARTHHIFLAGGLTPENVAEAIRVVKPYAVDVASGVESRPGKKDPGKLRAFFKAIVSANGKLSTEL